MWFAIALVAAAALAAVSPRLATASAWMLTLGINVPITMVGCGSLGWAFGLGFGYASATLQSWLTCLVVFGGPPSGLLVWWTFKD